ncbi:MAG TPA: DNA polymerase domain-containing protein [Candidatus Nitrosocosmicus sp.]
MNEIPSHDDLITNQYDYDGKQFQFLPIDVMDGVNYANNNKYVLSLYGILTNGQQLQIDVCDIRPFFDVLIKDVDIDMLMSEIEFNAYQMIYKKKLKEFDIELSEFIRFFFKNVGERREALKQIKDRYQTYSNDLTFHYRKVLREEKLSVTNWLSISSKNLIDNSGNVKKHLNIPRSCIFDSQHQPRENKTLALSFDIETYTTRGSNLPEAEYDEDEVFMICMGVFWEDQVEPLFEVVLSTQELDVEKGWIFKRSYSEEELILDFSYCLEKIKPDFVYEFNGGGYDWPFILKKAEKYKVLNEFSSIILGRKVDGDTMKDIFNIQERIIKISPSDFGKVKYFQKPGMLCIDTSIVCRRVHPKSPRNTLQHFLEISNLEGKADLSYIKLKQYYHDAKNNITLPEESRRNMYEIAKYCMIDARRCQELIVKNKIIESYRKTSAISYISFFDSYCYAIGNKVSNYVGAIANEMNILIDMIKNGEEKDVDGKESEGKVPGGYVREPINGLNNERPVTGLDFASLYPNLMITYNLSPDTITLDRSKYEKYRSMGYEFNEIKFMFNGQSIVAWALKHDNDEKKMGLYAIVQMRLKDQRKERKDEMKRIDKILEEKRKEEFETKSVIVDYNELKFQREKSNLEQNAIKVLMNSFYGTAGDSRSPLYLRELAGGVTSFGQQNIKLAAKYVESKGFIVQYGDTDSLYLTCPDKYYNYCDSRYQSGDIDKKTYWTEMINITMRVMDELRNDVNEYLFLDNGSRYLTMAYEEVLFPVMFVAKKKYFGIEHVNVINFYSEELFIRGIDVVKRGVSKFFKNICMEVMRRILSIDNDHDPLETVKIMIDEYMRKKHEDLSVFVLSIAYKSSVNNKMVQEFIQRLPDGKIKDGERFEYYIIRHVDKNASVGKRMILKNDFKDEKHNIDMRYYLKSAIGTLASIINYHERFQPGYDESDYKKRYEFAQKKAERFLETYIETIEDQIRNKDIREYFPTRKSLVRKPTKEMIDECERQNKKQKII